MKKKRRTNKKLNRKHVKSIDTSDPRINSKVARTLLEYHESPIFLFTNKVIDFVGKWDRLLGFKVIRILLVTIPAMIILLNYVLDKVLGLFGVSDPLLNSFPGLYNVLSIYSKIYIWLFSHGLTFILMCIVLPLSVPSAIHTYRKHYDLLSNKVHLKYLGLILVDLITMYSSIKYLLPSLIVPLRVITILLAITTIINIILFRPYQKAHGPFNPQKLLKKARRKEAKSERVLKTKKSVTSHSG